jgi:hypothetical protein
VVLKSLDQGLADLREAQVRESAYRKCRTRVNMSQVTYSDDLFKLVTHWAKIEESDDRLCEEHSRVKQHCKDSFLLSKAVSNTDCVLFPS